ncbi:hypothetical protein C490_03473 [Natronobacterium gregoryi SP2]|uniref:Uncharacterized protein n=1 Tax=Natronobacterium gregoryi (strain ATCC 43098 / DSM 3393 / CCM 3738 / CIP 104747 / IAM 13177 / JCM 8860 / NBRC 102187 / NCIMB 2189 / SP2) TaxID=797304 RepID=L9YFN2_NATGS|nr:hypothetical protein C490_03473 [Natronobacterium gregoryi SP2]
MPGDISQDEQLAVDAIAAETEPLERRFNWYWYEPDGIEEADAIEIPTEPKTRDDEHDIPTSGGLVHGASERRRKRTRKNSDALLESGPNYDRRRKHDRRPKREIRLAFGELHDKSAPAYTRIRLNRRSVQAVNELYVVNGDGEFEDWTEQYDGGVGKLNRGDEYWVRVNNQGVSELYLDVHAMDDDIASLSNAVYVDFDHGRDEIPRNVRRAVALRAGATFAEEATIEIPSNATVYNVETKAEDMRSEANRLLEEYDESLG